MEELIDVFLDELIDKKEISQNERTDMKLTLLEAMPNGLNDETKTRVMSTLKSKMDTPSANIFTDKGVNIEAVRTIATETVKNVVETVEKETSAREEAEAKRAAKVDDALSQTIAEADRKEELAQAEKENSNKEVYESGVFGNISLNDVEKAYNDLYEKYKNSYSEDEILNLAEIKAATDTYNSKVKDAIEKEGLSPEEARVKVAEEMSNGNPEVAENQKKMMDSEIYRTVVEFVATRLSESKKFSDIVIEIKETFGDKYPAIDNWENIIDKCHDALIKLGCTEAFLSGEESYCAVESENKMNYIIMNVTLERLMIDKNLDKAVTYVIEKYFSGSVDLNNVEVVEQIKKAIQQTLINAGLSKEQIEKGDISSDLYKEVKSRISFDDRDKDENGRNGLNISNGDNSSVRDGNAATNYINRLCSQNPLLIDRESIIAACEDIIVNEEVHEALMTYHSSVTVSKANLTRLQKESNVYTSKVSSNYRDMYQSKVKLIKALSDADKKAMKEGILSADRRNIIAMKKRFLDKAVELYLTGEKSAFEIIETLGDDGFKFEIIPEDIIMEASRKADKSNPNWSSIIDINERDIVRNSLKLEATKQTLENAQNSKNMFAVFMIKRDIRKLEKDIEKSKENSQRIKKLMGTLTPDKTEKLEQDLTDKMAVAINYTNTFEQLRAMQLMYASICRFSKEKDIKFDTAANIILNKKRNQAEMFGHEVIDMLTMRERPTKDEPQNYKEKIEKSIQNYNKVYLNCIEKNISTYEEEIQDAIKNGVYYKGILDTILQKDLMERELEKSRQRDKMLKRDDATNSDQVNAQIRELNAKHGAALFFEKFNNATEAYQFLLSKNRDVDFNQLLKQIVFLAKEAKIPDSEIRNIMDSERNTYKEYLKYERLKQIRESMNKQSKSSKELEIEIREIENSISQNNAMSKEFKDDVHKVIPDTKERLNVGAVAKYKKLISGNEVSISLHRGDTKDLSLNGETESGKRKAYKFNKRKLSLQGDKAQESQRTVSVPRKRRVNMLNVVKLIEANNTTSQEIVGATAELGKIVRSQDDKIIDSNDQRDS